MSDGSFTVLADALVAQGLATRGTMMGRPCLRANGAYFASGGHVGDALVVKLPEARVREEVAAGRGVPFAPGGTPFRQWLEITDPSAHRARELLFEALEFVAG
ncbi:hypothetical protein [Rubrivirga sp.]|uniref:hypothetical protein n=1 Tax=Rubrivirga sp. TaxID=1885344 RepID=UPI003B526294